MHDRYLRGNATLRRRWVDVRRHQSVLLIGCGVPRREVRRLRGRGHGVRRTSAVLLGIGLQRGDVRGMLGGRSGMRWRAAVLYGAVRERDLWRLRGGRVRLRRIVLLGRGVHERDVWRLHRRRVGV
jgi:hypothetical protein